MDKKFIIIEEMFKYNFIFDSFKNPIIKHNNILKGFDLFIKDNIIIK